MISNYTIAVCDILGFSDLVKRRPLNTVVNSCVGWLRKSLYHSINKNDFPDDVPSLNELQNNRILGLAWFSDTILIYTLEDTDKALTELLQCLSWLLFETIIDGTTHLRCGISYGEVWIDPTNSLFVGQPIIDAYQLEENQIWSGGALTSQAVERIPTSMRYYRYADWPIVQYKVPLKKGMKLDTLAIDWTIGLHPTPFELQWSENSAEPTADDWLNSPDVCEKWQNTREFHDTICRFCNPLKKQK
ncbi:MAG: hypothetical protein JXA41_16395 [Deltaproteobacteria bacterium]|nr:hypothetical protein [Deltaproteobacteria bacterium]